MFCASCGSRIDDNATQCPSCGEGVKRPAPVYVVEEKRGGCLKGCLGALLFLGLLFVGLVIFVGGPADREEAEMIAVSQNTSDEDAIANGESLVNWIRARGKQTRMIRDKTFAQLKGKTVLLTGRVRQVGKTALGDKVYVSLKVGEMNVFETINIQFNMQESHVEQVEAWSLDEVHTLRGVIKGRGDLEDDAVCDFSRVVK